MAISSPASIVLAGLEDVRAELETLYRSLHQHPELSHQERQTATAVVEGLQRSGFRVHQGVGGTGVVGVLRNGDGPGVLLRADGISVSSAGSVKLSMVMLRPPHPPAVNGVR